MQVNQAETASSVRFFTGDQPRTFIFIHLILLLCFLYIVSSGPHHYPPCIIRIGSVFFLYLDMTIIYIISRGISNTRLYNINGFTCYICIYKDIEQ